ncbi:hypothetical protein [uncultured Campylobacter sp.]|jgi:hypothetical protein|uniref:hypothetical protein n=1 Tax=uncultured Campylobacter sp. TaxID=218934 RepID=UPI00204BB6A0|nr:MAG TPA: RimK-related lysine biosynthesis protein, Probable-dependent amine/thiol ligase family Amino-group [Caudoviricetes sp.]
MTQKRNVINIKNADFFLITCKNCKTEIGLKLGNLRDFIHCPSCEARFSDELNAYLRALLNVKKINDDFDISVVAIDD